MTSFAAKALRHSGRLRIEVGRCRRGYNRPHIWVGSALCARMPATLRKMATTSLQQQVRLWVYAPCARNLKVERCENCCQDYQNILKLSYLKRKIYKAIGRCHVLISFFSTGFPLDKALAYAKLRQPFLINGLEPQKILQDRRKVYAVLKRHGLPTPNHVVLSRDGKDDEGNELRAGSSTRFDQLVEFDDYIEVNGVRISKPFVEKPVNGDDHNVYIYYPQSEGGGSKRLFRKVKNRSSEFYPNVSTVRKEGSYIYEEFLHTEGTDVKVYVVTSAYAHAEARKSPVVDGRVIRDEHGYEVRYPIMLTPTEKGVALTVSVAFGQRVCGFDLLRSNGKTYVCDVNGWSFVKKTKKYYDDASLLLSRLIFEAMRMDWKISKRLRTPQLVPRRDISGERLHQSLCDLAAQCRIFPLCSRILERNFGVLSASFGTAIAHRNKS